MQFVEKEARILNNPSFGRIKDDKSDKKPQKHGKSAVKRSSIATNTQQLSKPCTHYEGDHTLEVCTKLLEKGVGERLKCLKQLGVCFGCLKTATHMSKDCKKKLTCKKPHPAVLHIQQKPKQDAQNAEQIPSASNKLHNDTSNNLVCGLTGAGSMSPVPVLVHSRETEITVETLTFLDNGSDAVFISEELQQQLNAKGKTTKIQSRTVNDDNLADNVILSGLQLSDINGENIVPLPEVFTIKQIPGNTQNIVMPDDIAKWEYLQEVKLDSTIQDNMHVGILIGNNVPKATEPLKVINSQQDGPYACHTAIGWIVYGIHKPTNFTAGISVNRITVQESIESQLVKLYNHDFQESLADYMPEKSIKDKMFLANVDEITKLTDQGH